MEWDNFELGVASFCFAANWKSTTALVQAAVCFPRKRARLQNCRLFQTILDLSWEMSSVVNVLNVSISCHKEREREYSLF